MNYQEALDYLKNSSPSIMKSITNKLENDFKFRNFSEVWFKEIIDFLVVTNKFDVKSALKAFETTSYEHIVLQKDLIRNGVYTDKNFSEIADSVYHNKEKMTETYLPGLSLTYAFWYNHYKVMMNFRQWVQSLNGEIRMAEIGVGHGAFSGWVLRAREHICIDGYDISPYSLEWSESYFEYLGVADKRFFSINDEFRANKKYDAIICGEVLEHIPNPHDLIRLISEALNKNGQAFVTTVANAAAIDHLYLFNDVEEIRNCVTSTGLVIKDEFVYSLRECESPEQVRRNRTPVNVAYVLEKL